MSSKLITAAALCCSNIGIVTMNLAMLIIAFQNNNQEDCNMPGLTDYMKKAGALGIIFSTFEVAVMTTPCQLCGGLFTMVLITPLFSVAQIGLLIWGSVIAFPKYNTWTTNQDDIKTEAFCIYPIFMCAFTVLITRWVFLAIHVFYKCVRQVCRK